jgi:hypothetical protein
MPSEETTMRTQEQLLRRKSTTRKLSLALIAMGAVIMLMTVLSAKDLSSEAFFDHFEVAALWFVAAGAFVGLSRIWGELAERAGAAGEKV